MHSKSYECCIIGAGPAGLGAALELAKNDVTNFVIIDQNKTSGGLARTEVFDGVRFDIGPHRFFTKNNEINNLWHNVLGEDFKPIDRLTRIYYKGKYFNYPIKAFDALSKLGPIEALQAMLSFASSRFGKQVEFTTFEEWITHKFGRKLYEIFFKTYTEKVWGIPCSQIGADWASQRIKGLDLIQVLKNALFANKSEKIKTLVEQFDYPVFGAGQMYEAMADRVLSQGAEIMLGARVVGLDRKNNIIKSLDLVNSQGQHEKIYAEHFFSSIPLTQFFEILFPPESKSIKKAVDALYYRDHITINLLVHGDDLFPDQWIYVNSPNVQMARIANYNNFSKAMVGTKNKTALSVEYFVFQYEQLWKEPDEFLKALAIDELQYLKLINKSTVEGSWVVRETEAYPTYYLGFQEPYNILKNQLKKFSNICQIGRGGMYKYNNQDHSIISGMLAARNYLKLPGSPYHLWDINIDAEYHESAERNYE